MVLIFLLISLLVRHFSWPLMTVPSSPTTIFITSSCYSAFSALWQGFGVIYLFAFWNILRYVSSGKLSLNTRTKQRELFLEMLPVLCISKSFQHFHCYFKTKDWIHIKKNRNTGNFCTHLITSWGFYITLISGTTFCTAKQHIVFTNRYGGWSPRVIVANVVDCDIVVSVFELQSCYYVHFWCNTLGKGRNSLTLPSYGLNSTTTMSLQEWLWD